MSIAIIPMSHQFGWNSSVAGLVQSSFFWGYALSQLPGGWLAKIYGGRSVLLGLGVEYAHVAALFSLFVLKAFHNHIIGYIVNYDCFINPHRPKNILLLHEIISISLLKRKKEACVRFTGHKKGKIPERKRSWYMQRKNEGHEWLTRDVNHHDSLVQYWSSTYWCLCVTINSTFSYICCTYIGVVLQKSSWDWSP